MEIYSDLYPSQVEIRRDSARFDDIKLAEPRRISPNLIENSSNNEFRWGSMRKSRRTSLKTRRSTSFRWGSMRLTGRTSSKLIVRRVFVEVRPDESHRTSSKTRRTMSFDEVRPANLDEPHRFDEVRPVNLIKPHRKLVEQWGSISSSRRTSSKTHRSD